ncbi:MAG: hypothetical protein AB7Y46_14975 [Armatimonadota bacterium]
MRAPPTRREIWLCFALVAGLTLGVGLRGRLVELHVDWDGLAAVAHAHDVHRMEPATNLAMIGFVQPPLPALLQLPLVLVAPWLATSGVAANLQGALVAGVAAALLLGLAAEAGLGRGWRWPLVAAFALHPMVLGPASSGAPLALLTALLLGVCWALMRWARTQSLRDLIAASVVLAAALITRYESAFIVLGAMVYLAWRTRRAGGSWSRLEGTMITFALPVVYVAGIWIIANWAIMGDPWHFARESFAAAQADAAQMLSASLRVALVCFFPILALVYNQMRGAGRYPAPARPAAWLVVTAIAAPVAFPALFAGLAEDSDWSRLLSVAAMSLAGGFAGLAALLGEALRGRTRGPMQGTVVMAAASLGVVLWLSGQGAALPGRFADAYLGRGPLSDSAEDELAAARLLRATDLPPQRRHIIAGWPGFAVVLFADRTGQVAVVQLADLTREVETLGVGSRLIVLVGAREGGLPEPVVEAGLPLRAGLELQRRWQAGPWECFEVKPGEGQR